MQAIAPAPVAPETAKPPVARLAVSVDRLAQRYSRVLLSRRVLRASTVAGLMVGFMFLLLSAAMSVAILATGSIHPGLAPVALMGVAAFGLVVLHLRALSGLAVGSRRTIAVLVTIIASWLAVAAVRDIMAFLQPSRDYPFHFLALGALFFNAVTAWALVVGPFELWRADMFSREVFGDPRPGTGGLAHAARLLDLPDVRRFSRAARIRAWLLVGLALLLEGVAFYTPLGWANRFVNTAEKQIRGAGLSGPARLVLLIVVLGTLFLSFKLIRWTLRGARRLRLAARRIAIESADDVLAEDRRSPVLFLRSFTEEQVPLTSALIPWPLRAFDPGTEYGTLEEMIVHGLNYIGPVVAFANPSRADTPVGAARWRVQDEAWQEFVTDQIQRASLIVVGVGETCGLQWEIEALNRSPGALARTIFVCPPGITQHGVVLRHLADVLGIPPEDIDRLLAAGRPVHVLAVALLPSGPTCFVSEGLTETGFYVAIRSCLVDQRCSRGGDGSECNTRR